jgi:hypothetical protein
MMSLVPYKKGFTLMEVLLYLSLALVMVAILGRIGIDVLEGRVKAKAQETVLHEATFAFETVQQTIAAAEAVLFPVAGLSSSTLSLRMEDASTPTVFALENGRLIMREGDEDPVFLTGEHVRANVLFSNHRMDTTESVRVELDVATVTYESMQYSLATTSVASTVTMRK